MKTTLTFLTALLLAPLAVLHAADAPKPAPDSSPAAEANARLLAQVEPRFKAIYEKDEFAVRSFTATWLPDGSGYLKLETPAGLSAAEVARYDAAGGKRTVVVPSEKLVLPGGSRPLKLMWFQRAPSGNRFLLHGEVTEGKRRSGHWLYEPESGALRPVDDGPGLWFDANAFSPDGQRLLATRGADLIVLDLASGRTIPLTKDGDPGSIENGHRASWSPDGQWIAYIQSDASAVPKRAVLVPGDPTYRTFRETRYERIGGPISTFRIGVVGVEGGPTRWIALPDKPGTFYLNQVNWAGNADELLVEKLSRYRDAREFLLVNHQEIYMRTPKDNPEGYRTCAPITYAEGLRGDLLIITGSGESNTHVEITEGLVDRLIALGKRFDYFAYPNRDHGLSEGKGSLVHVRMLIARYLIEHLPPGPR